MTSAKIERFMTEAYSEAELDSNIDKWTKRGYRLVLRFPTTAMRIRVANGIQLEAGRCGALLEANLSTMDNTTDDTSPS